VSNPTWPLTLPAIVLQRNYSETAPNIVLRTQMDAGPAKVRRRFTANVRPIKAALILWDNQVQYLDNFFMNDCQGGALPFDWQTQRGLGDEALITDQSQVTDENYLLISATMRFVSPPTYTAAGARKFEAALDLEILP